MPTNLSFHDDKFHTNADVRFVFRAFLDENINDFGRFDNRTLHAIFVA